MRCERCQGFIVQDRFFDRDDHLQSFVGTRCLNCGDVRDPVLLHHRRMKVLPEKIGRQPRRYDVVQILGVA